MNVRWWCVQWLWILMAGAFVSLKPADAGAEEDENVSYIIERLLPDAYTAFVFRVMTYTVPEGEDPFQYQASGALPLNLDFDHRGHEVNPGHLFLHTGMISGRVEAPSTLSPYDFTVTYGCEQEIDPWTKTRNYRFYVDDFADSPWQCPNATNHVGVLPVQTSWSSEGGFVQGTLQPEQDWHGNSLPEDIDLFCIPGDQGVYCAEIKLESGGPIAPFVIGAYPRIPANHSGPYYAEIIASTSKWDVYNAGGYFDTRMQRLYFTNVNAGVFIRVVSAYEGFAGTYKLRVFRARPVILVHGIDSRPLTQQEAREGKNALGNWEDCLPWDANAYPCVCYNFCWDASRHNLDFRGVGKIRGIIERDAEESENPYVEKVHNIHGMDVVLIGHSMGGFIVRYALSDSDALRVIHKAVLLGSPMYGSDIALAPVNRGVAWLKNTSQVNLRALRRASSFVKAMHAWEGASKCLCIAGYGAPPRLTTASYAIPYDRGLGHSDGVVPVSSALLPDAVNMTFVRDHGTVGLATYVTKESQYPFDAHSGLPGSGGPDSGTFRREKRHMFADDIYQAVRNAIR